MKILGLIGIVLLLILLALVFYAIMDGGKSFKQWLQRRREETGEWSLDEISDDQEVEVLAICPGQGNLHVGTIKFSDPNFELKIEELRNEGRYKVNALNSGRREIAR